MKKKAIKESLSKILPNEQRIEVGDRVFIKSDLSKSRGREEYVITKKFERDDQIWVTLRKAQKGLRNKEYLLKSSEIFPAPFSKNAIPINVRC